MNPMPDQQCSAEAAITRSPTCQPRRCTVPSVRPSIGQRTCSFTSARTNFSVLPESTTAEPSAVTEVNRDDNLDFTQVTTFTQVGTPRPTKTELAEAKRLSKVLKKEAKAEEKVIKAALKELEQLQKIHKSAMKDESSALTDHAKAAKKEQKMNKVFLKAKDKYDVSSSILQSKTDKLDITRSYADAQTNMLHEKTAEVQRLRAQKATDDMERDAKLASLGLGS
ncbi:hypothetical protein FRC03_000582 [Tulasnella sp. 419]|nr:hypothetical protein FRC03_000582 [Tulasnella sp. 419]